MMSRNRDNIIPQMFDVRPVNDRGDLDVEKIAGVATVAARDRAMLHTRKSSRPVVKIALPAEPSYAIYQLGKSFSPDDVPFFHTASYRPIEGLQGTSEFSTDVDRAEDSRRQFTFSDFLIVLRSFGHIGTFRPTRMPLFTFAASLAAVLVSFHLLSFLGTTLSVKGTVLGVSQKGYAHIQDAMTQLSAKNFSTSADSFRLAYNDFSRAAQELDRLGSVATDLSRFLPFTSKLFSGKQLVIASTQLAYAGELFSNVAQIFVTIDNPLAPSSAVPAPSLLGMFTAAEKNLLDARDALVRAKGALDSVSVDDLPEDKRAQFIMLKQELPDVISGITTFIDHRHIIADLLGANGPRKYLFLFQNNHEMRATGGFIGSYGLLDIADGRVRTFFIDGTFNPDGQLTDRIVPPKPIQKISAAWSLHDSDWFPYFPTSAEKAILFYEKSGGPTVDGVVAITPVVMEKLLAITGPISLSQYDVVLTAENFMEHVQQEVEVDYDKMENKPKKILSDLAPIVMERLFASKDPATLARVADVLVEGFSEKHILAYVRNQDLQRLLAQQGWTGEIIQTAGDYVSVVNTNINGYKTDGVVDETITHTAAVQDDGSIIDTLTVTRTHTGGVTGKEWWDKVNADYMRVYVPQGAQLLSVEGHTREFTDTPLDYDALGFERDRDVMREESQMTIDDRTGTRIYEEEGKTVFANWVYVSPQETATITYTYRLPFTVALSQGDETLFAPYSVVYQKQSGSRGSTIHGRIQLPKGYRIAWGTPATDVDSVPRVDVPLTRDQFLGAIIVRE